MEAYIYRIIGDGEVDNRAGKTRLGGFIVYGKKKKKKRSY